MTISKTVYNKLCLDDTRMTRYFFVPHCANSKQQTYPEHDLSQVKKWYRQRVPMTMLKHTHTRTARCLSVCAVCARVCTGEQRVGSRFKQGGR